MTKKVKLRRYYFNFLIGLVAILLNTNTFALAEIDKIPSETATGRIRAKNGFKWNYGYDIELKEDALFVRVCINLIPARGVTRLELDRVKPAWKAGIEDIWSGKYAIITSSGKRYPIFVEAILGGMRFHHDVIVRRGNGSANELNWYLDNSPELAAHEFGHMLGLFDEYKGGAVPYDGAILDRTSIMTNNPDGNEPKQRHYQRFLSWFFDKTGLKGISLEPEI